MLGKATNRMVVSSETMNTASAATTSTLQAALTRSRSPGAMDLASALAEGVKGRRLATCHDRGRGPRAHASLRLPS